MDKKITIPTGIALMVVLAVAGMLAIFSYSPAPAYADLTPGTISEVGGTTTITVTTADAVASDAVISVAFPEGFTVAVAMDTNDITISKQTGDLAAETITKGLFTDTDITNNPRNFSVALNDSANAPAADDVIIIDIADSHITFPSTPMANPVEYLVSVGVGDESTNVSYPLDAFAPVLSDVGYDGPNAGGDTGLVKVDFDTTAYIADDDAITITFPSGFTVNENDIALSDVFVNDDPATGTAVASTRVVTVTGVEVEIPAGATTAEVVVSISAGIQATTPSTGNIGVQIGTGGVDVTVSVTILEARVVVTDVEYAGPTVNGNTGAVTVSFTSDTALAIGNNIIINFATGFTVPTDADALGDVPVNTDTDATATVSGNEVTVTTAAVAAAGAVSVAIEKGIAPIAEGDHEIGVSVNAAGHGDGLEGKVEVTLIEAQLSGVEVEGPFAGFYGDFKIEFTTNLAIAATDSIEVAFPDDIEFDFGNPMVKVDGGDIDAANVTLDGQTLTITGVAIPATGAAPADVTIEIESHEGGIIWAPEDAGVYVFGLKVGDLEYPAADYTASVFTHDVDFDTIPNKPNKNDEVIIEFNAPGGGIAPGSYITVVMHEDFQVPEDISVGDVTIDGNVQALDTNNALRRVADAAPASVTVDDDSFFDPGDNDSADWLIQIEVGDMAAGDAFPGLQGIDQGERVTVTIAKAAGIKAPSEASPDEDGDPTDDDGYAVAIALKEEPVLADEDLLDNDTYYQTTDRLVTLSSQDGGRGDEIVATAKGWPGETIDFWRDANADNVRQSSEKMLCSQVELTDNVAECTFVLDSTFAAGHGDPSAAVSNPSNCNGSDDPSALNIGNCNVINAVDSEGQVAKIDGEDDVIELEASVSLSPAEGNPGDSITVQIRDFPNGNAAVTEIEIAGAPLDACGGNRTFSCGTNLNERGDADVDIEIPNVDPGTRLLTVHVGDENEDTNIVIGGGSIIATPTTVIPNQDVTLVGSGFGTGGGVRITNITLGSDTILNWPDGQNQNEVSEANNPNKFDLEDLRVDSGGSWSLSVYVPVTQDTADAGSDGSNRTLTVTDSEGRSGTTTLTFAQRSVTVSPEESRRGSTISLSGENFPGLNKDGLDNLDVEVFYDGVSEESVEPDVNGRWQTTIEVPRDATIPSTNVIRVQFGAGFTEIDTYRHRVPRAAVTISPASGPEGSMVSLEGSGFGRFESLDELTVGGNDVTVSPNPSTDRNGDASFTFQIPGLDAGTQNVVVDFDGVTASVAFAVAETSGVVGAVTSDVEVALEPLLTEGTLDRVFYFNNESKEWQWHIVDPDFASTNNLDDVVSGAPLWVLVTEDTSATLNGRVVNFTCAGDDCWNLVTFP